MLHFVVFSCDSWHFKFAGLDILTIQLWINLWSISFLQRYFFVTSRDSARYKFPTHSKDILIWRLLYSGVAGSVVCTNCLGSVLCVPEVSPAQPSPGPRGPVTDYQVTAIGTLDTVDMVDIVDTDHYCLFIQCSIHADDMPTFDPRSTASFAAHPESALEIGSFSFSNIKYQSNVYL